MYLDFSSTITEILIEPAMTTGDQRLLINRVEGTIDGIRVPAAGKVSIISQALLIVRESTAHVRETIHRAGSGLVPRAKRMRISKSQ